MEPKIFKLMPENIKIIKTNTYIWLFKTAATERMEAKGRRRRRRTVLLIKGVGSA